MRRVVGAICLAVLLVPPTANAAYPGANGKIAFSRGGQIWTMNADGTGQTQLTNASAPSNDPEWSPDGAHIAYTRGSTEDREVRVMNADGSGDARVAPAWTYSPAWGPDGRRIAFVAPWFDEDCGCWIYQISEAKLDGSNRRIVADGYSPDGLAFPTVNDVEWSPRGDELTFRAGGNGGRAVYAVPANGGVPELLAGEPGYEAFGARWSPDAARLALIRQDATAPVTDLTVRNRDGSGLTYVPGARPSLVEWSPDGQKLIASEFGGLYTVNPDGTGKVQLIPESTSAPNVAPDWQPVIGSPGAGYPRPKGASPVRVPLVPSYSQCTSANRVHGPPLAFGSCNPPGLRSSNVTVGTPDANGAAANMSGFLRLTTVGASTLSPDDADLSITGSVTDVRCQRPDVPPCSSVGNTHPTPDYIGVLTARLSLRLTDRFNLPSPGGRDTGTVTDTTVDVPLQCTPTAGDPSIGSACAVTTTANALNPGLIAEGRRSVWQLEDVLVYDTWFGASEPFLRQGIFVP